jgi:hypothetical protein
MEYLQGKLLHLLQNVIIHIGSCERHIIEESFSIHKLRVHRVYETPNWSVKTSIILHGAIHGYSCLPLNYAT